MSEVFLKIVNMSISASWLVFAVLLLRILLKKAPKWASVLLWGFVAVRLICPFSFESVLSLIPSAETISPEIMMDATPQIHTGISALNSMINPVISESFAPNPMDSANPLQIWIPVAANLWLAGIAAMLIYTAVSYIRLRRKVSTAVLLRENIFQSEHVDSPFVLGLIKPRIYLPFQMDGQNLVHVVAHEQAHIRRKDHWWKPLGFLLLALHWFNPIMWLGYIFLCRDIELACDEKVIKEMDSETKADYTQALVQCSISRRSIAACPLAFGEVGVKARIKSVLHYKKPAFWIVLAAIVTCIAVAVCFLTNPVEEISLSKLSYDEINMPGVLDDVTEITVTYKGNSVVFDEQEELNRFLAAIDKINVSKEPISKNRSEDRSKDFTIKVNGNTELHFNKSFTEVWEDNHVKPSLTHRITNPQTAKELISLLESGLSQVRGKTYLYENDGILGSFTITLYEDGTFTYYEGSASSYFGTGTWKQDGDTITMTDDREAGLGLINRFKLDGDDLVFIEQGSYNFIYVKVKDGEKFCRTGEAYKPQETVHEMTLDDVRQLSKLGMELTWEHVKGFKGTDIGSGLSVVRYDVDSDFYLLVGGAEMTGRPMYADLYSVQDEVCIDIRNGGVEGFISQHSVGTEDMVISFSEMDGAIASAILHHNRSDKPDGLLKTENHIVLAHQAVSGTPAVGQTEHVREEAVFVYYLTMSFGMQEGVPEEVDSIFGEAIILFEREKDGVYTVKDFLRPQYSADYSQKLMQWFGSTSQELAQYQEEYDRQLRDGCWRTATEYFENLGEGQPGAAVISPLINSISYDIDGDGELELCSIHYGPTSGLFSIVFYASPMESSLFDPEYSAVCTFFGVYNLSFEIAEDGALRLRGDDVNNPGKVVYFDIALEGEHIILTSDEEPVYSHMGVDVPDM